MDRTEQDEQLQHTAADLLQALKGLMTCIESEWGADLLPFNLGLDESKEANDAILAARSAIAEAEGTQS